MSPGTSVCCAVAGPNYLGALIIAVVFGGITLWCLLSLRRDARREARQSARRRHPSSRRDRHGRGLSRRDRQEWERITASLPELAEMADTEGKR